MTETVSNRGREDVLTQVRQLVSAVQPPPEPEPERVERAAPAKPGALLLTPALRVPEPNAKGKRAASDQRPMTLEERIAELEAAVGNQVQEWEPDGSEGDAPHQPSAVIYPARMAQQGTTAPREHDAGAGQDSVEPDGDAEAEARFVHLDPDDPARPDPAAAPEASADDDEDHARSEADGGVALFFHAGRTATPSQADQEDAARATPEPPHPVEEALQGADGAALVDDGSDAVDGADTAAVLDDPEPAMADEAVALDAHERLEAVDEDELRRIVRAVLLEELTGPLGEKMTRNIRKMLRREIDRALSLREFD